MIFGKSDQQRKDEQQAQWKSWYEEWPRKFLLFPRWLHTGQLAWLQWVYVRHPIYKRQGRLGYWYDNFMAEPAYYLHDGGSNRKY